MQKITRRTFLTRTSVGVAAAGAMAAIPGASVLAATRRRGTAAPIASAVVNGPPDGSGPLVVSIADRRSGTFAILSGESEVTRHDPALVAALLRQLA